jgi:hypothetical protein
MEGRGDGGEDGERGSMKREEKEKEKRGNGGDFICEAPSQLGKVTLWTSDSQCRDTVSR